MARETFTPPPPGSKRGGLQYSFRSATTCATLELLSIAGFMVMVTMVFMDKPSMCRPEHFFQNSHQSLDLYWTFPTPLAGNYAASPLEGLSREG
jgi:hypothetical protein